MLRTAVITLGAFGLLGILLANIQAHAYAQPRDPFAQLLDEDERDELAAQRPSRVVLPAIAESGAEPADSGPEGRSEAPGGPAVASGSRAGLGAAAGLAVAGYAGLLSALAFGFGAVACAGVVLRWRRR